jgi:septum formation protein
LSRTLILASNSPRRRALLAEAGFHFESFASDVTERLDNDLTLGELTRWNALRKGLGVARRYPDKVVLAADTLVALEGRVIGKPNDLADAVRILQELSARTHEVCSAVFLGHRARRRVDMFEEVSRVRFKKLSRKTIDDYLARISPLDKAGAYAAQGEGTEIIEEIEGSYTNVVGLPMERTIAALARFGVSPKSA